MNKYHEGKHEAPAHSEKSVASRAKGSKVSRSGDVGSNPAPEFQDAGTFIRGGGKIDDQLDMVPAPGVSLQKGSKSVPRPSLEKGSKS